MKTENVGQGKIKWFVDDAVLLHNPCQHHKRPFYFHAKLYVGLHAGVNILKIFFCQIPGGKVSIFVLKFGIYVLNFGIFALNPGGIFARIFTPGLHGPIFWGARGSRLHKQIGPP